MDGMGIGRITKKLFDIMKGFIVVAAFLAVVATAFGALEGMLPCGSEGEMLDIRVEECLKVPCQFVPGRTYNFEVDFIPKYSHDQMGIHVEIVWRGQVFVILDTVLPTPVNPGNAYTLAYDLPITGDWPGAMSVWIRLQNNNIVELCGMATAHVEDPKP